jgi:dephospho-CoA kinase
MKKFKQFCEELEHLEEGVNDPAIFKAVFLAGGPGSGKSFIAGKTALTSFGFRVINSDESFEHQMSKAGLDMSPEKIFSPQGQKIRAKSKAFTMHTKRRSYMKGALGLVIDGTGKDIKSITAQKKFLEKYGYETAIIIVNTNLDTAVSRDAKRKRTIGKKVLEPMWQAVQDNIGKFQQIFGKSNTYIVDNSDGKDFKKETMAAYKGIGDWSKKPPKSRIAKKWIEQQKKNKTR